MLLYRSDLQLFVTKERCTFRIADIRTASRAQSLDDGKGGHNGGSKSKPVNKSWMLMSGKNTPKSPGYDDCTGGVSLYWVESVANSGQAEEDQADSDKELGPDTSVFVGILAKCGKDLDYNENGAPAVKGGPGKIDKKELPGAVGFVGAETPVCMRHDRC